MLVLCRQAQAEPQVTEEERKRYEQEFEDYHKKLQDAKDEYVCTYHCQSVFSSETAVCITCPSCARRYYQVNRHNDF